MNSQLGSRMVYDNVQKALTDAGLSPSQVQAAILSQSFLRLEQPITNSSVAINFPILNNQTQGGQSVRATERRLNLQDAFYASDVFIFLTRADSPTATDLLLQTYPNPVIFPIGGATTPATPAAAPLQTFYNGILQIAVNNRTIVPAMDMEKFQIVPQTQLTAATNSPQTQTNLGVGCVLEPNIVMIGSKNTQIQILLPGAISSDAIDAYTYAVIMFRGVLAQNVTVVS